jgi:hypothetical protein
MATSQRDRIVVAARLRRSGAGTFQWPPGTLSSTVRRVEHAGLQPHDRRPILSRFAWTDETRFRQTARDHDAKEFVASRICFVTRRRIHQGEVRGNSRITRSRTGEQNEARGPFVREEFITIFSIIAPIRSSTMGPSSGSSNSIRCTKRNLNRWSVHFQRQQRSFGVRKNRKTWARGCSWSRGCVNCSGAKLPMPAATPTRVLPWDRSCSTNASKLASSKTRSASKSFPTNCRPTRRRYRRHPKARDMFALERADNYRP